MKKFSQNEVEAQAVSKLQQVHFEIESDIESSRESSREVFHTVQSTEIATGAW